MIKFFKIKITTSRSEEGNWFQQILMCNRSNLYPKSMIPYFPSFWTSFHVDKSLGMFVVFQVTQGVMLLVFAHVILLGIEVDISARSSNLDDIPSWFSVVNLIIVP